MDCPKCGLVNPDTAQTCDCGYDFEKRTVDATCLARIHRRKARNVGMAHRLTCWAALASILAWVIPYAFIVAIPFMLWSVYNLAKALDMPTGSCVLCLASVCIPVAGLICLLILNDRAAKLLRQEGIPVGFFGARVSDLPEAGEDT